MRSLPGFLPAGSKANRLPSGSSTGARGESGEIGPWQADGHLKSEDFPVWAKVRRPTVHATGEWKSTHCACSRTRCTKNTRAAAGPRGTLVVSGLPLRAREVKPGLGPSTRRSCSRPATATDLGILRASRNSPSPGPRSSTHIRTSVRSDSIPGSVVIVRALCTRAVRSSRNPWPTLTRTCGFKCD